MRSRRITPKSGLSQGKLGRADCGLIFVRSSNQFRPINRFVGKQPDYTGDLTEGELKYEAKIVAAMEAVNWNVSGSKR